MWNFFKENKVKKDNDIILKANLKADRCDPLPIDMLPGIVPVKVKKRKRKIEDLRDEAIKTIPLGQNETILGKYLCADKNGIIARSSFDSDWEYDLCEGIATQQLGSLICTLTSRNLYMSNGLSPEGNFTIIPLEDITGIKMDSDGDLLLNYRPYHTFRLLLQQSDTWYFRTTLLEAMTKRKEKIEDRITGANITDFSSIKEYLKNRGVVMETFKCPGCGASLEFPDKIDTTTCQNCGNKIKAVDLFEKIRTLI